MISLFSNRKNFSQLSEKEVLALAISNEEDDSRIYASYAARLRNDFPGTAAIFDEMTEEENEHRRLLIDEYQRRFDGPIPLIRREHVAGYFARRPVWLLQMDGTADGGANVRVRGFGIGDEAPRKLATVHPHGRWLEWAVGSSR